MKVSVIIPTYKGSNKLSRAIQSVLQQDYPVKNIEIIVVDDNAPESDERRLTEEIMKKFPDVIYLKHHKNLKGAQARNTGIKVATGDFISFLDDDDFMLKNRISDAIEFMKNNNDSDGIYCSVIILEKDKIVGELRPKKRLYWEDMLCNELSIGTGSNIFLRKHCFDNINFDIDFLRNQDVEFMINILSRYKVYGINEVGLVKSGNGTINSLDYFKMKAVKQQLFKKYEYLINAKDDSFKKQFRILNAEYMFKFSKGSNYEGITDARKELERFRQLTFREKTYIFILKFRIKDCIVGKIARRLKWLKYTSIYDDKQKYSEIIKLYNI